MPKEQCGNCKYFRKTSRHRLHCLRNAPMAYIKSGFVDPLTWYPSTGEADWCGDYVMKEYKSA